MTRLVLLALAALLLAGAASAQIERPQPPTAIRPPLTDRCQYATDGRAKCHTLIGPNVVKGVRM